MSSSNTRPPITKGVTTARPLPLWWAALAGVVMGLVMLAFIGPSAPVGPYDPATVVPADQVASMANRYKPVEFSTLSGFEYGDAFGSATTLSGAAYTIPADVLALSGTKVGVGGFMLPLDVNEHGVATFILNASYDMCYFGAPTLPHQFIVVRMRGGRRTRFVHTPIAVFGTLNVREERRDGRVVSLYEMEADNIAM
jgi:hypothetical protein